MITFRKEENGHQHWAHAQSVRRRGYVVLVWIGVTSAQELTKNVVLQLREAVTDRIVREFTNSMAVPFSATTNALPVVRRLSHSETVDT